jgi:hypothetical protein
MEIDQEEYGRRVGILVEDGLFSTNEEVRKAAAYIKSVTRQALAEVEEDNGQ